MELKDFAKEAQTLNITEHEKKAPTKRQNSEPVFAIEAIGWPDIVISRTTPRMKKTLVLMPTQDSYYLKSEPKSGDPIIERLTVDSLRAFITNYNGSIVIPKDFWFNKFPVNKMECENLMEIITYPNISEMLKNRCFCELDLERRTWSIRNDIERVEGLFKNYAQIYRGYKSSTKFCKLAWEYPEMIKTISDYYGVDRTRKFLDEFMNSLVNMNTLYTRYGVDYKLKNIFKHNIDINSFIDYVCYESVCMGYGESFKEFLSDWSDALDMQETLYGKVKEKYPKNLPTLHNQLSYKVKMRMQEIEKIGFAEQSAMAENLEAIVGDWTFIAPKSREDFLDEATQQANCLASYIQKFARGEDYIMFMRKADDPKTSYITIELSLDGHVIQAYRARNRHCSEEELDVINKWLERVSINFDK